jgi:hypothetical protein
MIYKYGQEEHNPVIKKLNENLNNTFDYIIFEHCPTYSTFPQLGKYNNLLKKNGFLIIFVKADLDTNYEFTKDNREPILENIFTFKKNNIYQKTTDKMYNMNDYCEQYIHHCLSFNPTCIFEEGGKAIDGEQQSIFQEREKEISGKKKYLKYKLKYLKLKKNI